MVRGKTDERQEELRLNNLHAYEVLDTPSEASFDRITRLAKLALKVPIVLISLVDENRQWFKSKQGLEAEETPRDISFCDHAIRDDGPMIVEDARADSRFRDNPLVTGGPRIRFYAGVPLTTPQGFNIGTLCIIDIVPRKLSKQDLSILQDLAQLVIDQLELRQVAMVDSLTGALTRRAFDMTLKNEIVRARRYTLVMTLVTLDIDHFAQINQRFGHAAGDQVLRDVTQLCQASLRECDVFARLGGEEFAILLPETGIGGAMTVVERLRSKIAALDIAVPDAAIRITASFGISTCAEESITHEELLESASKALLQAKRAGRNRASVKEPSSKVRLVA